MSISSNTLFHFTDKKEVLQKIITDGFKMSYCLEGENAFPMVSFCDLPFSSIKEQLEKYGSYGIGMSLSWGKEKKLNPVFYFDENSHLIDDFKKANLWSQTLMMSILTGKRDPSWVEESRPFMEFLLNSSRYQKFYMSDLIRDGKTFSNYKFYNEREWRYVPEITHSHINSRMNKVEYEEYKKTHFKPHINEFSLKFTAKDIRYIILKDDTEILGFIHFLKQQTSLFKDDNEFEISKTKITTTARILDDI
jgi:hypothetical protein